MSREHSIYVDLSLVSPPPYPLSLGPFIHDPPQVTFAVLHQQPMHVAAFAFLAPLASKKKQKQLQRKQVVSLGTVADRRASKRFGWFSLPYTGTSSTASRSIINQRSPSPEALPWWSRNTEWLHQNRYHQIPGR